MRIVEADPGRWAEEMRGLRGKTVLVYWVCHIDGHERRATGYIADVQGTDLLLSPEWNEARQNPAGQVIGPIALHRITYFRELVEWDAPEKPSEEMCLEFTRRALVQAGALVQTAIFEFWKQNGRPSQQSLEALRDRLTAAVDTALCTYYGASAGPEWERPHALSDADRLEWLQEISTRLSDVYWRMENEGESIHDAIDALMEMK